MPAPREVADLLNRRQAPTLLLDTCSIIDVARAPIRMSTRQTQDAYELILMGQSKSKMCSFVIASPVQLEYDNHVDSAASETSKRIDLVTGSLDALEVVERWLSPSFEGFARPSSGISKFLLDLAHQANRASIRLNKSQTAARRAIRRVASKTLPAKQGKDSTSDCLIFEEYLELGRLLGPERSLPVVMLSSNKQDFHHEAIRTELSTVGIKFAYDWSHARHLLGL